MTGGLRLALRLAWRNALGHRLATALTALLVAVPVVALVAIAVLGRSSQISQSEQTRRVLGHADALLTASTPAQAAPVLPSGSQVLSDSSGTGALADGLRGDVDVRALSYDAPIARGIIHQRAGRAPRAADEVVATTYLAGRLHLRLGQILHLFGTPEAFTLVGTVVDPSNLDSRELIGPSESRLGGASTSYLVDLPLGVDPATFHTKGYSAQTSYESYVGALLPSQDSFNDGALVVVLGLLEAALTAGTAFAVAARRSRRDLALLAVNGGRQPQIAAMVLSNGIVCGVIGVVSGVGLGIAVGAAGLPLLQRHSTQLLNGLTIDVPLIVAAAAFGLVSAILAALLPAWLAARTSLRSALGGARGVTGTPGRVSVAGVISGVFGVLLIGKGGASYRSNSTTLVLLGIVALEFGAVAICPVLIGAVGKFGARLPALPRLALRDAARQRARSGPAVAAIAAAVSGAIAVSVFVASYNLHQRLDYAPSYPMNIATLVDAYPVSVTDLNGVLGSSAASRAVTARDLSVGASVTDINSDQQYYPNRGLALIGSPALLQLLGASPAAQQAFALGEAVGGTGPLTTTNVQVALQANNAPNSTNTNVVAAAAGWSDPATKPAVIIPPALAANLGLAPVNYQYWAPIDPRLSDSARKALQARASDLGYYTDVETGPLQTDNVAALGVLGVAVAFSLIVTAAATALAAAESRADLAILAAIGATGRVRRLFTAAQGLTTALLGAVLGIAIGAVIGIAVVHTNSQRLPLFLPWQPFLAFLVGLPALAGLGGLLFSRSRLPGAPRVL